MDFDKLQTFITEHASEYLHAFAATLRKPILKFPPSESTVAEPPLILLPSDATERVVSQHINPHLMFFAILCIFIGSTLHALVPGKKSAPGFVTIAVLVAISWLVCSCIVHVICLALRGRGSFILTVSICIQLFAVIYVVSSFAALIASILVVSNSPSATPLSYVSPGAPTTVHPNVTPPAVVAVNIPSLFGWQSPFINISAFFNHPFLLYFLFQTLLLTIYLPFGIKWIHGFRGYKALLAIAALPVGIIPFTFVNISTYEVVGSPLYGPPPTPRPIPTPQGMELIGLWHSNAPSDNSVMVFKKNSEFVMGHLYDIRPDVIGNFFVEDGMIALKASFSPFEYKELERHRRGSNEDSNSEIFYPPIFYVYRQHDKEICPARDRNNRYRGEPRNKLALYWLERCWTKDGSIEQGKGLPDWVVSP